MIMLLNNKKLKAERKQRAWSQSQLAQLSGMSLRTIQRIEKNGKSSLESAKALASVYCVSVTELYLELEDDIDEAVSAGCSVPETCYLSRQGKTLSITMFLLSTLVMLFLLWTNIPIFIWINEFRDAVFSAEFSSISLKLISSFITIVVTISFSITCGLLFDMLRNDGLYFYLKDGFQSGRISFKVYRQVVSQLISNFGQLIFKPLMITGFVVLLSGVVIYLNMEDYQKQRIMMFFE